MVNEEILAKLRKFEAENAKLKAKLAEQVRQAVHITCSLQLAQQHCRFTRRMLCLDQL